MLNNSPFFILGNPRSGTTLLRLMLDAHSKISVPPECGFMVWYYSKYKNTIFKSKEDVSGFISDLKQAKKIESWKLNYNKLLEHLMTEVPCDYTKLVKAIYYFNSDLKNVSGSIWGDKNNFYINHIKDITELFPDAKFVHIIRDGRDVACSYLELNSKKIVSDFAPKLPSNITDIAHEWQSNNNRIINDVEAYSNISNYFLIRYEDLIDCTEIELQKLTRFLGLKYQSEMLLYYEKSKSYEPKEYLQWKGNTTKPVNTNSIGRYKLDLSKEEIEYFNRLAEATLRKYDYEHSS